MAAIPPVSPKPACSPFTAACNLLRAIFICKYTGTCILIYDNRCISLFVSRTFTLAFLLPAPHFSSEFSAVLEVLLTKLPTSKHHSQRVRDALPARCQFKTARVKTLVLAEEPDLPRVYIPLLPSSMNLSTAKVTNADGGQLNASGVSADETILQTCTDLEQGLDPVLVRAANLSGICVDATMAAKPLHSKQ